MSSRIISLIQAQTILASFSTAYAAANSDLATKQRAAASARTTLNQLAGSGASQAELQAQAAVVNTAQANALIAQNYAKDLMAANTAAQNVFYANGGVTGPVSSTENPFVGPVGPTGPAAPLGVVVLDTVPTLNSTNAVTSGAVYNTAASLRATPATVAVGTSSTYDDGFTKLLYHFDGLEGATQGPGLTYGSNTAVCSGGARLTTATSKFGTACLDLSGSGAVALSNPLYPTVLTSGSAFTIEFWFKMKTMLSNVFFVSPTPGLAYNSSTQSLVVYHQGNQLTCALASPLVTDRWYHVAFSKSSIANDSVYCYLDGVKFAAVSNASGSSYNLSPTINYVYLDEYRLSVGVDRYPGGITFTPPTTQFMISTKTQSFPSSATKGQIWTDGTDIYLCTATGTPGSWSKKVA